MDTHQAIYDAIRSKISGGNIDGAVRSAIQDVNIGHYLEMIAATAQVSAAEITEEHIRPSVLFRPSIAIDGDKWCALYGENLQDGVAGFGDSPAEAMKDFDSNWRASLPPKT